MSLHSYCCEPSLSLSILFFFFVLTERMSTNERDDWVILRDKSCHDSLDSSLKFSYLTLIQRLINCTRSINCIFLSILYMTTTSYFFLFLCFFTATLHATSQVLHIYIYYNYDKTVIYK